MRKQGRMATLCWLGLWLCLVSSGTTVWAQEKEREVALKLVGMEAEALSEENGDEIYISLTKYSNQSTPEEFRIPSAPTNWFFTKLNRVKDVVLWRGKVQPQEELKFMISIAEQDFPPWDVDDLIGTVQVNLKNEKGHLKYTWMVPKMDGQPRIEELGAGKTHGQRYVLHGDNSKYDIQFALEPEHGQATRQKP